MIEDQDQEVQGVGEGSAAGEGGGAGDTNPQDFTPSLQGPRTANISRQYSVAF